MYGLLNGQVLNGSGDTAVYGSGMASILPQVSALLENDFSGVPEVTNASIFYTCQLVNGSTVLATVPMSSWGGSLELSYVPEVGTESIMLGDIYLQAVIPAVDSVEPIAWSASKFAIFRCARMQNGRIAKHEIISAPIGTMQFDKGPYSYTCTIRGNDANARFSINNGPSRIKRSLQDIRSTSVGSGGVRVRCGIDWFLKPGHYAILDNNEYAVSAVSYYVSNSGDSYMDVRM